MVETTQTGGQLPAPGSQPAARKPELNPVKALRHFLREVWVELGKTKWPTRHELAKFTFIVMVTIVIVAVYLGIVDKIASLLMKMWLGGK